MRGKKINKKFMGVLVGMLFLLLGGGQFLYKHFEQPKALANVDYSLLSDLDIVMGDAEAPITIIEYSSLTCGHCAHFHNEVLPKIKRRFIDTGKVRFIFKHFPLDQRAIDAAVVLSQVPKLRQAQTLARLFERQNHWISDQGHRALSEICQLDPQKCLQFIKNQEKVDAFLKSRLEAEKMMNINATPTFIVQGKVIPYAPTYEEIERLIEPNF